MTALVRAGELILLLTCFVLMQVLELFPEKRHD